LLERNQLPGVWVVATAWEPEAIPDANGGINPDAVCHALALALVGMRAGWHGIRLRVVPGRPPLPGPGKTVQKVSQLQALLSNLASEETGPDMAVWPLEGVGWIELGRSRAGLNGTGHKPQASASRAALEVGQRRAGTENIR